MRGGIRPDPRNRRGPIPSNRSPGCRLIPAAGSSSGHPLAATVVPAPRSIDRPADPDSRGAHPKSRRNGLPGLEPDRRPVEREPVEVGPEGERTAQSAGPARQLRAAPPGPHQVEPVDRLERPNEHALRFPFSRGDHVEAPVHAVVAVHVDGSGWSEQGCVPSRPSDPGGGVRGRIFRPRVGFRFHDPARGQSVVRHPDEQRSQESRSEFHRWSGTELRLEGPDRRSDAGPPVTGARQSTASPARPLDPRERPSPGAPAARPGSGPDCCR